MNSSGIKRGVAFTVASAVAIGTPVAVYAATAGDGAVYAISQSADKTSLPQYAFATIDGKATVKGGLNLYTDDNAYTGVSGTGTDSGTGTTTHPATLDVTITESVPAGTDVSAATGAFEVDADGSGPAPAATLNATDGGAAQSGGKYTAATTLTATATIPFLKTDGTFEYKVASANAGTVSVTTGDASKGGTATTSLTVGAVQTGNTKVASISVTPASVNQYAGDTSPTYSVTALDANGVPVSGATVSYTLNGQLSGTTHQTPAATYGYDPSVSFTIADSDPTKTTTDAIVFFVDQPTSPTGGPDANDPQKSVSATFTKAPVAGTDYNVVNSSVTPTDATLPADNADVTETVKVFVADPGYNGTTNTKGVSGINVAVDAAYGGAPGVGTKIGRVTGVTGADGTATLTFTLPKAAANPSSPATVYYSAYVTGLATYNGGGQAIGTATTAFQTRQVSVSYAGSTGTTAKAQATVGGTVSLPIVVADQFGKPAQNATLAYSITGNRGNTLSSTPITTDANGKATITYTDQNKGAASDTDSVAISDPFNSFGGGTLLTITVQYVATLSADATATGWEDGALTTTNGTVPTAFGTAVGTIEASNGLAGSLSGEANAVDANGVPTTAYTVGTATMSNTDNKVFYAVQTKSKEGTILANQKVTFSAPGGILTSINPSTNKQIASGLGTLDVTTDVNGLALVVVGAVTTGDVTTTATSGGFTHAFKPVRFEPDAGWNVSSVSAPSTIKPGDSVKFIYKVTDEFGNAVYGFGPSDPDAAVNPYYGVGGGQLTFTTSTGKASDPGSTDAEVDAKLDSTSEFAVVLSTLASDSGNGTLVVAPKAPGKATTGYYSKSESDTLIATASAQSASLAALLKPYVGTEGVSTPFTVTNAPTKTDPTLTVSGKSTVTYTKKWVGKGKNRHQVRVAHHWDIISVYSNVPAGATVTVNGRTQTKATGPNVFKFADGAPKKFTTYTASVSETDTTNAASASAKVK